MEGEHLERQRKLASTLQGTKCPWGVARPITRVKAQHSLLSSVLGLIKKGRDSAPKNCKNDVAGDDESQGNSPEMDFEGAGPAEPE